jgi:predicted amidohydrolase
MHFRSLAKELDMAIIITYLRQRENDLLPSNSASLIDRHGEIIFTYDKVHTCEFFPMENACTPGSGFYVHELDTRAGPVKVGMMICYDREAPESARILMLNGAEIILTPNACDLGQILLNQFQVRAFENAVAMAMANYGYGGDNRRFDGHSCMFNASGERIMVAGSEEGVYTATINLHDLRKYRKETIWGNAFRRPHKYEKLISPEVEKVFEREDSFGNRFERLKR